MNKKMVIMIYIILFVIGVIVGVVGFNIYDNLIKNNDGGKADSDGVSYAIVDTFNDGGLTDKELYVNEKLVVFNDQRTKFSDITIKEFNDDLLLVEASLASSTLYVVNKDAKVIGVFTQANNDYYNDIKILPTKANYRDTYRIDGNSIYIQSDLMGQAGADYALCYTFKNDSDIVLYEEKFEYLGNNEFGKPIVVKTMTRGQYMKENNIVCE